MKYSLAPMEGITGYVYRNVHHSFFPESMSSYYTPFLNANQTLTFTNKEKRDVSPENNAALKAAGVNVIPQILTRRVEEFVWAVKELTMMGYGEVNLNLGCPAPTVVNKGKGAGFLKDPDDLDEFLNAVFEALHNVNVRISLKTRIGMYAVDEMDELMKVYNRYPVSELIIHPRVRQDFYRNHADLDAFGRAFAESHMPVVYNGDVTTPENADVLMKRFPELQAMMIGRGLVGNPALVREITGGKPLTQTEFKAFLQGLWDAYEENMESDMNVICKMKELWIYMGTMYEESERYVRKIQKAQTKSEYKSSVLNLMGACRFKTEMHVTETGM
ncbi:MAG: tRNA-dihydrouridine synthase family protein [Butyrivibrio sp.]|nr:tRNA-dihydrouridine synthase family protein [Butyrivibrio sp.]